jgi:hypothetical protein
MKHIDGLWEMVCSTMGCRFILSTFYHDTTSEFIKFAPGFSATDAKRVVDRNEIAMGLTTY